MSIKIITCIYSNLHGTEYGGRPSRYGHYRWSLLSLLRMENTDFVCYTSSEEYEDLKNFFYTENKISENKLEIKIFDLKKCELEKLITKYKNVESVKNGDRCVEIQYMKYFWFLNEDLSYDYYYWFDAGLSHCGLIPNKYLAPHGIHNSQYYDTQLFDGDFTKNLLDITGDKFLIVAKENQRNYWSGTVNPIHFYKHDSSYHVIGGFFGGKKDLWLRMVTLFTKYVYEVTEYDGRLYHEEDIMTLMYRNHPELFVSLEFDTWWHEDMIIDNQDMEKHVKENKSFYKIIEEIKFLGDLKIDIVENDSVIIEQKINKNVTPIEERALSIFEKINKLKELI